MYTDRRLCILLSSVSFFVCLCLLSTFESLPICRVRLSSVTKKTTHHRGSCPEPIKLILRS